MFQFLQSLALDFLYTSGVHFFPGNFSWQENKLNSNVQKIIKSSSALCTDVPPPSSPDFSRGKRDVCTQAKITSPSIFSVESLGVKFSFQSMCF